jgi:hypothetical protein
MSTNANQNKPSGYINISAAIKSTFNCCNNSNSDVLNRKAGSPTETVNELIKEKSSEDLKVEEEAES